MSTVSGTSSASNSTLPYSNYTLNTSGSGPVLSFNGLISGINTQQIIQALMTAYKLPQTDIHNQINQLNANMGDYQQLSGDLTQLQSAADAISQASLWNAMTASSSNSAVATATASPGASPGSISFNVNQLAQADLIATSQSVSSTSATVASSSPFLLSTSATANGVTSLTGSSLALGTHTFDVTQALTGGVAQGSSALASSVTISTGTNDVLSATVNGTAYNFVIAAGTYAPTQLASAIDSASNVAGSQLLQATVTPQGTLKIGTTLLGSSASLQLTGGTALSSLGMTAQATVSNGTAGTVTLDGTSNSINNVNAGSTVTLSDGTGGTITAGVGDFGLSQGTFTAQNVSTGNGSLSNVVSNINNSGAGVTASAVQVASGSYILQIASNTTGVNGAIVMDQTPFTSYLGGFNTVTQAQDAKLQVGGSQGYILDSASNSVTGLLPDVAINLQSAQAPGSTPVTVSVSGDGQAMAQQVQNLVNAANQALSDINKYAGYNYSTNTGGPLMGDSNLNSLTQQILGVIAQTVGSGSLDGAQAVGVSVTGAGTIDFNQSTFLSAYAANPSGVAQIFTQQGNFTPSSSTYESGASLLYAPDTTPAGSYAINVTHSATQAVDTGSTSLTGTIVGAETLTFSQGGSTASYSATAGESLSAIASGLNQAFSSAGLSLNASVATVTGGTALVVNSVNYGSAQSFSVTSTATGVGQTGLAGSTGSASFAGTDVAGSIDGIAATGTGQTLAVPLSSSTIPGFSVTVTAPGITSSTNIGTINYTQGIAGGLAYVGNAAASPINGSLTYTIASLQQQISGLQTQYNNYTPMIQAEQTMLEQEFSAMEATLGGLQNTSQAVSSQIAKLP
jgi:flagellar hook-associated protein 2